MATSKSTKPSADIRSLADVLEDSGCLRYSGQLLVVVSLAE